MKRVALVTGHYAPSNLAAVHRSRMWSYHLREFGWEPVVVTTHWDHYEEQLDWDLADLLPEDVEVVRTGAIPTKPVRLVGDIGFRGFLWHYNAIVKLARTKGLDFVHINIPSNYSALLGRLIRYSLGIPYGIDYIDPWVHFWPGSEVPFSKAWLTRNLSSFLEPIAVKNVSLISGITPGYCEGVFERHPELMDEAVEAYMPYGASEKDFEMVRKRLKPTSEFEEDGLFHVVYAGALLPKSIRPLRHLLEAMRIVASEDETFANRFRLHMIGTGSDPVDNESHQVLPIAREMDVEELVTEHPARMSYVQVLSHLVKSSGILILGSIEPHYSPSKTFQAIQAEKPIMAILHEVSTAVTYLRECDAGEVVTLDETDGPDVPELCRALRKFMARENESPEQRPEIPEHQTARGVSQVLAEAMDEVLLRRAEQ